jgi:hypothetical protein
VADTEGQDQNKDERDDKVEAPVAPVPRVMVVPGNDLRGYIGVSPEYMNYADPTQKPYLTQDEARLYTTMDEEALQEEMPDVEGYDRQDNEKHFVAEDTATGAVAPRHRDDEPDGPDPYADPAQERQADGLDRSEPGVVKPAAKQEDPTQPEQQPVSDQTTNRPPLA